jgi:hypothetical protein
MLLERRSAGPAAVASPSHLIAIPFQACRYLEKPRLVNSLSSGDNRNINHRFRVDGLLIGPLDEDNGLSDRQLDGRSGGGLYHDIWLLAT